jgi:hypothetical protein
MLEDGLRCHEGLGMFLLDLNLTPDLLLFDAWAAVNRQACLVALIPPQRLGS